jgi:hypothetical protein
MRHPLEFLPYDLRKPFFYVFFALTLIIFGVFSQLDQPLRNDSAPSGIVSFELARDVNSAQRMADSWGADARLVAAFGLGFDYLFMPVYASALSLGLLLALDNKPARYRSFAALMGWGVFVAALFDAVENYALWHTLTQNAASPYPQIAALCAIIKFTLLILGFVTIAAGKAIRK